MDGIVPKATEGGAVFAGWVVVTAVVSPASAPRQRRPMFAQHHEGGPWRNGAVARSACLGVPASLGGQVMRVTT
jgi:hypothetical protein